MIQLFLIQAVKGTRQMQQHVRSNFERHLSLMCKTVKDQDEQMRRQQEKIVNQDKIINDLSQTIKQLSKQLEQVKRKQDHEDMSREILHEDLNEIKVGMKEHEVSVTTRMDHLAERIDHLLITQSISDEDIKDSNRYGEHLWTIHNFNRRLQRIQSGKSDDPIRSEPFYTGLPGYKLCIWVYLNGRGKSLGRAMSVYGKVMLGEFDAILPWPIRPQFTFTLFEQNKKGLERRDIVRTRQVPEIKREEYAVRGGIPRPQAEERSIIVGFDDFVTHIELEDGGFLKDDDVFLKIEAEILH